MLENFRLIYYKIMIILFISEFKIKLEKILDIELNNAILID